jgi:N-acetylmuramoyl-L-alanine amidase
MKPTIHESRLPFVGLRFANRAVTNGITVHCSASRPSQNWGPKEIDRMHRQRGFTCVGYHFIIMRDGTIWSGRPLAAKGAHCVKGNRNATHLGICLIGGISEKPLKHTTGNKWNGSDAECNFTDAQKASLKVLLTWLREEFSLTAATVEGHRDVPGENKACPSFDVQHWKKTGEFRL